MLPHWINGSGVDHAPRVREGGLDVQSRSIYIGKREETGAEIREGAAEDKLVNLLGIENGRIIEDSLPHLAVRPTRIPEEPIFVDHPTPGGAVASHGEAPPNRCATGLRFLEHETRLGLLASCAYSKASPSPPSRWQGDACLDFIEVFRLNRSYRVVSIASWGKADTSLPPPIKWPRRDDIFLSPCDHTGDLRLEVAEE